MGKELDEYELPKLLNHIADCIGKGEYDELDRLLLRVDKLREKGVNVNLEKAAPVLDAYVSDILDKISDDKFDAAENVLKHIKKFLDYFNLTIDEKSVSKISDAYVKKICAIFTPSFFVYYIIEVFRSFLDTFNLSISKESAFRISDSYAGNICMSIEEGEYDDAKYIIEVFRRFPDTFNLSISEESASKISDAYVNDIYECIEDDNYDDAEARIDELKDFLADFGLTAEEKQVSKIMNSYASLVKHCIGKEEFDKADEFREKMEKFKEEIEPQ